jgi:hypothetical protein
MFRLPRSSYKLIAHLAIFKREPSVQQPISYAEYTICGHFVDPDNAAAKAEVGHVAKNKLRPLP